jgi:MYXO-CTERM domain-containing protein
VLVSLSEDHGLDSGDLPALGFLALAALAGVLSLRRT